MYSPGIWWTGSVPTRGSPLRHETFPVWPKRVGDDSMALCGDGNDPLLLAMMASGQPALHDRSPRTGVADCQGVRAIDPAERVHAVGHHLACQRAVCADRALGRAPQGRARIATSPAPAASAATSAPCGAGDRARTPDRGATPCLPDQGPGSRLFRTNCIQPDNRGRGTVLQRRDRDHPHELTTLHCCCRGRTRLKPVAAPRLSWQYVITRRRNLFRSKPVSVLSNPCRHKVIGTAT
jgi:hypothetical protein